MSGKTLLGIGCVGAIGFLGYKYYKYKKNLTVAVGSYNALANAANKTINDIDKALDSYAKQNSNSSNGTILKNNAEYIKRVLERNKDVVAERINYSEFINQYRTRLGSSLKDLSLPISIYWVTAKPWTASDGINGLMEMAGVSSYSTEPNDVNFYNFIKYYCKNYQPSIDIPDDYSKANLENAINAISSTKNAEMNQFAYECEACILVNVIDNLFYAQEAASTASIDTNSNKVKGFKYWYAQCKAYDCVEEQKQIKQNLGNAYTQTVPDKANPIPNYAHYSAYYSEENDAIKEDTVRELELAINEVKNSYSALSQVNFFDGWEIDYKAYAADDDSLIVVSDNDKVSGIDHIDINCALTDWSSFWSYAKSIYVPGSTGDLGENILLLKKVISLWQMTNQTSTL